MAKNRRKPRTNPTERDEYAFIPLVARCDAPVVTVDASLKLTRAQLVELPRLHGVDPCAWMSELEARVGGMSFGQHYSAVYLGLRYSFSSYLRFQRIEPLPRARDGQVLFLAGVEGDCLYFVSENGEAWAQDGIADKHPHREAASFDELAARLNWPPETRGPRG